MKVKATDSTMNFKSIKASKISNVLFTRLKNANRFREYENLVKWQENRNFDIVINSDKNNRLIAELYDENGRQVLSEQEKMINAILNFSPINFLTKVCKKADSLLNKSI